ncbi:BatD family protein [Marinomonas pollencensis]|uniref:Oxygen tolerance protein BatD n=1 Tax=Marinomonas pollencensis TaxID=491954 RepID=A0A3E0DUA4_9GAMM|nr:BatD family protein [Marinomonas pollencensis]REG86488.1 oxygen tolerance protein BatD [Marinomonas pollencensis]
MVTTRLFHSSLVVSRAISLTLTAMIVLTFSLLSFTAHAESLVASLDKTTVVENQVVQLTLRANFTNTGTGPDLSPLKKDFDILGQSQNSQFSFNVGSNTALTYWVISLMPKSVGTFEIPPITIAGQSSQAIKLVVKNAPQLLDSKGNPPVMVKTQISDNSPYLQQQVILSEQLFTSVSLQNANLSRPANSDLVIERLSDDQMAYQTINGTRYQVLTRQYLLFPQKSGTISIAPQSVRAMINTSAGNRIIKVQSDPVNLQVQAIPASYPSDNWLPSQSVTINTKLSKTSDAPRVGDTLIWQIEVSAKDALPEQIPQLTFDSTAGYKLYPQPIKFSSQKNADGIVGQQSLKIEVVPTQAGTLTLPQVNLTYWNTDREATATATASTPSMTIAALPTTPTATPKATTPEHQQEAGKPIAHQTTSSSKKAVESKPNTPISLAKKPANESNSPSAAPQTDKTETKPLSWRQYTIITLIILLAILSISWLILFTKRRKKPNQDEDLVPTLQEFAPLSSSDENSAFNALTQCCRQDNLGELRSHLLEWARHRWGDEKIRSLDDIKRLAASVKLTQLLMEAELMLYSKQASNQWQGTSLAEALEEYKSGQPKKTQASQLKTLYPNF